MLGPDHVEVTKRCAELENLLRRARVLHGQRRIEKATERVEMRRRELAVAEELLRVAHERRDKAFRECVVAQGKVLHAREGQEELVGELRGADSQSGHAGSCLLGVRDAPDCLLQTASVDGAGNGAKQLVEDAKSELAALEYSLNGSRGGAGTEQVVMDAASGPGVNDKAGVDHRRGRRGRGGESRDGPLQDREAHRQVQGAACAEERPTCWPRWTSRVGEVLKHARRPVLNICRRSSMR